MVNRCIRQITKPQKLASCAIVVGIVAAVAISGCGLVNLLEDQCNCHVQLEWLEESLSPIGSALRYLEHTQFKQDQTTLNAAAYAGDWPQCIALGPDGPFFRDTSPFMATFIHHALSLVTQENQDALQLDQSFLDDARAMRKAAIEMMLRFQADPASLDAGTFGFWPLRHYTWLPGDLLLALMVNRMWHGFAFMSVRSPINVSFYPADHAIPSDADDTATIYAALLDNALLDDGPEVVVQFEQFFADWRDLGLLTLAHRPDWLKPDSGAFLTWLAYLDDPGNHVQNDVDIIVNANILYVLGRYERLDVPGVQEAIELINATIEAGYHQSAANTLSPYYPDNFALHYCITRAYSEGGLFELQPAVDRLVADLLDSAQLNDAGQYHWDRGSPHLNTAFGLAALLNADQLGSITESAIDYLISQQDPTTGSWEAGPFFGGLLDDGAAIRWVSPALTTAIALEALAKYQIATSGEN